MKVYPLVLGPVQTSCYIISNHERAVVVDPAANANQIIQYLGMKKLKLEAIFLTHGHFDHIGAVTEIVEKYRAIKYTEIKDGTNLGIHYHNGDGEHRGAYLDSDLPIFTKKVKHLKVTTADG